MIRAFVAIALPEQVSRSLQAQQAALPAGRAVPPENFHVTLAFLGEYPMPVIEDVHFALDGISAPAFRLRLEGIGLFGGERPRSIHALVRPDPALAHLRARVLDAARSAGIALPRERFLPHVTIARLPQSIPADDIIRLRAWTAARAGYTSRDFDVAGFSLFRSRLGRSGASYEAMADYALETPCRSLSL